MSDTRLRRYARPLASLLGATLAAVLAVAPAAVLAQDESPAASEAATSPVPMESAAPAAYAVELVPAELAGVPVDPENIVVFSGQEIIEMNPDATEQFQAVAEATGTAIDDMTQVSAFVEPAEGEFVFFGAIQVPGADAVAVLELLLPLTTEAMQEPRVETAQIGDRQVTILYEDAMQAAPPTNLIPSGDIIWVVQGAEAYVPGVIEQLPS